MSYANATVTPAERAKAAASVIGLHALIGFGLVAGLAVTATIIEPDDDKVEGVFIELPPPPPPEPTDVPPDTVVPYTPPAAPIPPVPIPRDNPINVVNVTDDLPPVTRTIPDVIPNDGPIAVEPPVPTYTPTPPRPSNAMGSWITTNDYSRRDLTRGNEGTASYRLVVGSDGRVDACEVTRSTGHGSLDRATCRLIQRRARFDPATNNRGEEVVGTYTGTVTWQIPE
ncbi:energy transducer TonB [Aurantiacibacter sp. D1-12]|uniref:energy transducer TonB n=1 Tax=Aurantiacibacter sp. D1-12 TaxID=2993658 RepID=UPI00237CEEFB|nr:energy transducer TonB [Aurantiacibacter sp. D1-12]MDE1466305.1 energy transducer TonB [Aurantiacibacter sp. D1-12]